MLILGFLFALLIFSYCYACWLENKTVAQDERVLHFGFRFGPFALLFLFGLLAALGGCATGPSYGYASQSRIPMDYMEVRQRVREQDVDRFYCTEGLLVAERNGGGRIAIDMTLRCL